LSHSPGSFDRYEQETFYKTKKMKRDENKSFCEEKREASLVNNPEQAHEIWLGKIVTPHFKTYFLDCLKSKFS